MKLALLTIKQVRQLFGQELAPNWTFNPVINRHGVVFISEQEIAAITNPAFDWVKLLPLVNEIEIKPPQDLTPPASDGVGIVITNAWRNGLNWPITLNGLEIELKYNGTQYYIERSVHQWSELTKELNKPQNDDFKALLIPFFNYLKNTAVRINL